MKVLFPVTKFISKSGKDLGTRLIFTKIKKNLDQLTLFAKLGSGYGKRTIFYIQPNIYFLEMKIYEHLEQKVGITLYWTKLVF